MDETPKPTGWRTFAIKMAVLFLVWTTLATVFAAQFYWIAKGLPFGISWKQAFLHSFIEWCPWLMLSPLIMWLAERFRFDRAHRVSGVLPHLPACVLVALAYHGISVLLTDTRMDGFGVGTVRVFSVETNLQTGALPPPGVFIERSSVSASKPAAGAAGFAAGQGGVAFHVQNFPAAGLSSTNMPPIRTAAMSPGFATATVGEFPAPFFPGMPGPWTRFFHLAATRAQYTIPIYWAIVCVTWVISYYQQLRERERRTLELEARLTQANLQTLKTQLQPHFLFNTLNAISSFVRRKPDAAEDMIGSLSDFLRMNLEAAPQHEVPLRRELEFLDLYLEIQQTRFGERLQVQKDIDPTTLDIAVPSLILQPLVENSVRHGIEPRETGGTILIRAARHGDLLRLEVRDDGEGFKSGHLAALREGIGLSNTTARLQELYGDAHRFQMAPNTDGGLTVTVELPWREAVLHTNDSKNS